MRRLNQPLAHRTPGRVEPGLLWAAAVAFALSASGCASLLNNLAEHGPWGTMCHNAPIIPNPARTHAPSPLAVHDQGGQVVYAMSRYDPAQMCFTLTAPYAPARVAATRYEVEALTSSRASRDSAPKAESSRVRVVNARSRVRVVRVYDAKLDAMVDKPETFYTTHAEVCFDHPQVLSKATHVMLLYPAGLTVDGLDAYAAWRLQ